MIKPLLRVIPSLSGNVKLACELNTYAKVNNDEYNAFCRNAWLFPLSSAMFQKKTEISLLNSSWEFDIVKFYKTYSDIFYRDMFEYDSQNFLYFNKNVNSVIKDRNNDFEFGCKRISYAKTGKQLAFFAPIYCDNVNDIPDYFKITIELNNGDIYSTTKTINVQLTNNELKNNFLSLYLNRYFSKIDDNVIFMMSKSKQALYYGIDVQFGGFNSYIDNVISALYTDQTSINGFDAKISKGFQRNGLIMRQIMPLSFYFNIDDVLTDVEKIQYKNAKAHITGIYYKNNQKLSFYNFDDNYENLKLPIFEFNELTGEMYYNYDTNNILDINNRYSLNEKTAKQYNASNKINKAYVRWKLKYSTDEQPYIINNNYSFSANQKLNNLYYQYPQNYYYTTLLCNTVNNEINVLLPISSNITEHYGEYQYLTNKYKLSMNNYVTNWFDIIDECNLEYIIKHANWQNVFDDNKIFYKGLLYNFNSLYVSDNINRIDKFAILFYIDGSHLYTKNNINEYVSAKYSITNNPNTNNIQTEILGYDANILYNNGSSSEIYQPITTTYNSTLTLNEYYTYNLTGTGKYVDITDLMNDKQIDYYTINTWYDFDKDIECDNESIYKLIANSKVIKHREYIPCAYISNIYCNSDECILEKDFENYFVTYNTNTTTNKLNEIVINKNNQEYKHSYALFYPRNFISYNSIYQHNLTHSIDSKKIRIKDNADKYLYHPIYKLDNGNTIKDVFTYIDNHNKFYGDTLVTSQITYDSDVLYVDPYVIEEKFNNYYDITGMFYISNIDTTKNYVTLSSLNESEAPINLFYTTENEDKIFSESMLNITQTYAYYTNNNKTLVNKYITKINNVYLENLKYETDNDFVTISYYNYNTENNSLTKSNNTLHTLTNTINCYSYIWNFSNPLIVTNNVLTIDNPYKHNSYIGNNLYVSNVDKKACIIELSDFSNSQDTIQIVCNDINELHQYGYLLGIYTKINNTYIISKSNIVTYVTGNSYFYNSNYKLENYSYLLNNPKYYSYYHTTAGTLPTYLISSISNFDYIDIYNRCNLINSNVEINLTPYTTNKAEKSNLNIFVNDFEKNVTKINHMVLNELENPLMYGKFINRLHIIEFITSLRDNAYKIENEKNIVKQQTYNETFLKLIYIKTKQQENHRLIDCFTSLYDYLTCCGCVNELNDSFIGNILNKTKQQNDNSDNVDFLFNIIFDTCDEFNNVTTNILVKELYFLKSFMKITKPIMDIISLNSDYYKDLYIYKLESDNDVQRELYYGNSYIINSTYFSSYTTKYNTSYSVVPLFNSIYNESMNNTKIYSSYIMELITPVNVYDENRTLTYTLYRYNCPNKLMLCDVSNMYYYTNIKEIDSIKYDEFTTTYTYFYSYFNKYTYYDTNSYSFIYNSYNESIKYESYSYTLNGFTYTAINEFKPIVTTTYYSSIIPTYDKIETVSINYHKLSDSIEIPFSKYNINTYTMGEGDNKTTYGFYLSYITISNINNLFKLMFTDYSEVKYFTTVNGKNITDSDKHVNLSNIFKYMIPSMNVNVLSQLYNMSTLVTQFKSSFKQKYLSTKDTDKNYTSIIYNKNSNEFITLYRYFDNIIPYIVKTNNINTEYALKCKTNRNLSLSGTAFYKLNNANIYNYDGIHVYSENNVEPEKYKQIEYKYFNDNQFVNLETEFEIPVSKNLSYSELLNYEKQSIVLEYFEKYLNKFKKSKYNNDEILFLFNKYTIQYVSYSSNQIDLKNKEKKYSLIYKFILN